MLGLVRKRVPSLFRETKVKYWCTSISQPRIQSSTGISKRVVSVVYPNHFTPEKNFLIKPYSSFGLGLIRSIRTDNISNNKEGSKYVYTVRIVTGKRRGSGTTAQVFIRLIGSKAKTGKFPVNRKFDTASIVEENLYLNEDLGTIRKVHIGHDNIGDQGVGWYLEHVDVMTPDNTEHYFPVQRWLGQDDFGSMQPMPTSVKVSAAAPKLEHQRSISTGLKTLPLKIEVGAAAFPHPDKVKAGTRGVVQSRYGYAGEDAYSISPIVAHEVTKKKKHIRLSTTSSIFVVCAVADGVYSWRDQGIDAGEYSRFLVRSVQLAAQKHVNDKDVEEDDDCGSSAELTVRPDAANLLSIAENKLSENEEIKGSCTACIGCIDGEQGLLKVANLGDSGAMVLRRGLVVFRTPEQEHEFGFPFQMPVDRSSDCQEYSCPIFDGDVVVMGSDGLFDNVSDEQIEKIVRKSEIFADPGYGHTFPAHTEKDKKKKEKRITPAAMANALGSQAFRNSMDKTLVTPYSMASSEAFNMIYTGGKMDDICCVVAIISGDFRDSGGRRT